MRTNRPDALPLLVSCPKCQHSHTVQVRLQDLPSMRGNPAERMYRLRDLEQILGFSRRHLMRLIKRGDLNAVQLGTGGRGSPWLVAESELTRFRRARVHRQ